MQFTAAGLQIWIMMSAVPVTPELAPAVPIVRPVRGMSAQVTIIITAAMFPRISEIFEKLIENRFGLTFFSVWTDEQTAFPFIYDR